MIAVSRQRESRSTVQAALSPDAGGKVKRRPCHQLVPKVAADDLMRVALR